MRRLVVYSLQCPGIYRSTERHYTQHLTTYHDQSQEINISITNSDTCTLTMTSLVPKYQTPGELILVLHLIFKKSVPASGLGSAALSTLSIHQMFETRDDYVPD